MGEVLENEVLENGALEREILEKKILKKIPYDEDNNLLSFVTDASTVYVDGVPLKDYLEKWTSTHSGAAGKDGATIKPFDIAYAAVSDDDNSLTKVKEITSWSSTIPNLSNKTPHLWKRTKIVLENEAGVYSTQVSYEYCGSLGTRGLDGEWREWVFKIDKGTDEVKIALETELAASELDENFLKNDFVPTGWTDDMEEITEIDEVQWCASRDKIEKIWLPFKNLHIFGRKPKDGNTSNNIYTISIEIDKTKWELDKDRLIKELIYVDGDITSIPSDLNYEWLDDVPNAKSDLIIYLATCYFTGEKCTDIDDPIRITGPEGPGSDGNGLEFAYYPAITKDLTIPKIAGTKNHFLSFDGWYDTAGECPISDTLPYQFVSQRLGLYTNDNNWYWLYQGTKYGKSNLDSSVRPESEAPTGWNYGWSDPVLWSSWGQDGVDGDGVQYVFLRLTKDEYDWVTKYGWDMENMNISTGTGGGNNVIDPDTPEKDPDEEVTYSYYIGATNVSIEYYLILDDDAPYTLLTIGSDGTVTNDITEYYPVYFEYPNLTAEPVSQSVNLNETYNDNDYAGSINITQKGYSRKENQIDVIVYQTLDDKLDPVGVYFLKAKDDLLAKAINPSLEENIQFCLVTKDSKVSYKMYQNTVDKSIDFTKEAEAKWIDVTEKWVIQNADNTKELLYKIVPTDFNKNTPYFIKIIKASSENADDLENLPLNILDDIQYTLGADDTIFNIELSNYGYTNPSLINYEDPESILEATPTITGTILNLDTKINTEVNKIKTLKLYIKEND